MSFISSCLFIQDAYDLPSVKHSHHHANKVLNISCLGNLLR